MEVSTRLLKKKRRAFPITDPGWLSHIQAMSFPKAWQAVQPDWRCKLGENGRVAGYNRFAERTLFLGFAALSCRNATGVVFYSWNTEIECS